MTTKEKLEKINQTEAEFLAALKAMRESRRSSATAAAK